MNKDLIVKLYVQDKFSLSQIGKRFNLSYNTIKYHLLKSGVAIRPKGRYKTFNFNEDFFNIPNELNSYWAGFIAADFGLRYNKNIKKGRSHAELSCSLAIKDKEQLVRFMNDIKHKSKIRIREKIRNGKKNKTAEISITSSKMLDDLLINFNISSKNKTLRLNPPNNLDKKNKLAFILGYIDGDGWLQYRNSLNLGVCGTFKIVNWIKINLEQELLNYNIKAKTSEIKKTNKIYVWRANIYSWKLSEILNDIPVVKLNRKIPQIQKYKLLHKNKFKNKSMKVI